MIKKIILSAFICCITIITLSAQTRNQTHILHLKNGSALIGIIEQYTLNQPTIIRMSDGEKISVPFNSIDRIEEVKGKIKMPNIQTDKSTYAFKEKGWHLSGNLGLISGGNNNGNGSVGYSIDLGAAYHFQRLLGLGLHIGYDSYINGIKQDFIPVYATLEGYLNSSKTTLFYTLGLGYGISSLAEEPFGNENSEAKGGLFLYPKVGIRLKGSDGINMTLFGGVKIQESTYELQFCGFDSCDEFIRQDRTFQRIVFGVGFVF